MKKLSETDRQLVHQRYTSETTLEEFSKNAGRSPGALRISLYRIRAALRNCISRQLEQPTPAR